MEPPLRKDLGQAWHGGAASVDNRGHGPPPAPHPLMPRVDVTALTSGVLRLPESAGAPVRFAADELQRYLHGMTGVRLPVQCGAWPETAIVLGARAKNLMPSQPLPPGSCSILVDPPCITLAGGSPRALLDAVYAFLQQLGCRWSLHGAREETVPRLTGAIEVTSIDQTPRFAARGYCSDIMTWHYTQAEHFNARLDDDRTFIDWMGKSGANTFFYIRHPFDSQLTIPELAPEFQRRGIEVEYGGHVIPLLLPRELYCEHPEYFPATVEGSRTDHGNLCTSHPDALTTAGATAVRYVRDYPELRVLHIWGADLWHGGWCRCAGCRPVSAQDQSLRVCNAVARRLAEDGVGRPVCYLAYHDTLDADLTLRPDEHVLVEFAPRERCYGHALNDPDCATNRRYAAALERYVELFEGRVRLFEYYGDAILYFGCAVPLTGVIEADLEYYHHLGVPGITMLQFGTYSLWAYPLNFLAFAEAGRQSSGVRQPARTQAYCARFGAHTGAVAAAFAELEAIMSCVVTYGDICRPPRAAESAARLLNRLEAAVPQLARLVERLNAPGDEAVRAQAALLRYTQTVLRGVQAQIQMAGDPDTPSAGALFAEALDVMSRVDRQFKGLWGAVDLPIIHSFFSAPAGRLEG